MSVDGFKVSIVHLISRCSSYRGFSSSKMTEKWQGPTLGAHFKEVFVKRELTVCDCFLNIYHLFIAGPDKLSKPVAAQKWDRIKLVCTQPFNKVHKLLLGQTKKLYIMLIPIILGKTEPGG